MPNTEGNAKIAYSIREACQASSLGRTTIYGLIRTGELQAVRVGGRTVIPAASLNSLLGVKAGEAGEVC